MDVSQVLKNRQSQVLQYVNSVDRAGFRLIRFLKRVNIYLAISVECLMPLCMGMLIFSHSLFFAQILCLVSMLFSVGAVITHYFIYTLTDRILKKSVQTIFPEYCIRLVHTPYQQIEVNPEILPLKAQSAIELVFKIGQLVLLATEVSPLLSFVLFYATLPLLNFVVPLTAVFGACVSKLSWIRAMVLISSSALSLGISYRIRRNHTKVIEQAERELWKQGDNFFGKLHDATMKTKTTIFYDLQSYAEALISGNQGPYSKALAQMTSAYTAKLYIQTHLLAFIAHLSMICLYTTVLADMVALVIVYKLVGAFIISPLGQLSTYTDQYEAKAGVLPRIAYMLEVYGGRPIGSRKATQLKTAHIETGPDLLTSEVVNDHQSITLNTKGLTYAYGDVVSLHNVSCSIKPTEKVAVIGTSGSGKSTLLRLFAGYPRSPNVVLNNDSSLDPRVHSVYLPPEPQFYFDTISNNLQLTTKYTDSYLHSKLTQYRLSASRLSHLEQELKDNASALSSGERQRLALLRLYLLKKVRSSAIVLLDQPFSALDQGLKQLCFDRVLTQYAQKTVIMVVHDTTLLDRFDRVMLMQEGRIVAFDHPLKVKALPEYTQYLRDLNPQFDSSSL